LELSVKAEVPEELEIGRKDKGKGIKEGKGVK
jgi:hypothetical protein